MKTREITRIPCTQEVFRNIRLYLQLNETYFISGHNSLYVPSRQEKYILSHRKDGALIARLWEGLDGKVVLMTPGEAARTELQRAFPDLVRVGWRPSQIKLLDWRSPMYFSGPFKGKGIYIDIKSAYWQIYERLWLDVAFPCGFGTLDLQPVANALKNWKAARNSVVGITRSREAIGVAGLRTIRLSMVNPFLSPCLWATIQAVLNMLAFVAVQKGAIYVATDGYIFPLESNVWQFQEYLYDLGLDYRQTTGPTHVKFWGGYRVGNKATKPFLTTGELNTKPFNSIKVDDPSSSNWILVWWAYSVPKWRKEVVGEPIS